MVQVTGSSVGGDLRIGDIVYTRSNLEELKDYLARAVAAYEARMYAFLRMLPPPAHPYKFLYPFGIEDAPIFFGREVATEELYNKVLRDRLTVLHAKSGAGKTSLLNAGLTPRFIREGRLPFYIRAYEDPILALKRLIASAQFGPWPKLLHDLPLHDLLGLVYSSLTQSREVIVILDHFEQFFLLWPQQGAHNPFIRALGTCYDDQALPLRIIITLRKDYYSDLIEFEQILPHLHVFQNQYRLNAMTPEEAQQAMFRPLTKLGVSVTYEPALLETLLADLSHGQMELPLLQIICTRLYDKARDEDEVQITLKTYEELGQAQGVLSHYLKSVLADLGREEALARNVLKELVRSDGMNQVLSYKAVAARIEAQGDELDRVLDRFVNARLLRRDEIAGEIAYELAHEYLMTEIVKWLDPADQEFKQAEELLQREVANWHIHHMLIPKSRLEVLYTHRERFKWLDVEEWKCLVRSALAEDFAVADWVKAAGGISEILLSQALTDSNAEICKSRN